MSRGDVLVRMKADTSSYNAGIASANKTLAQFKQANLTMGGVISQLTKSLTAAAAGYMSMAAAGSAITGLVKESVELAKAGEGIRLAFQRLNRPDLLDGLRQATHNTITDIDLMKAAVRFDDFKLSLDDMGTMLAFAQQKAKDTGQSVDYMVESITMGLGRQSKQILDNLGISASEITERMKKTGDMTKAVAEIIREQMAKSGDYIETAAERATKAEVALKNEMDRLGQVFAPLTESANSFFSAVQIGAIQALTAVGRMLNSLSSAGRAMNAFTGGGDASVQKGLGKLRVAKAAGSSYMVNSLYNDQVADYNRQINDYDAQIKNGGKRPGAGSGESRDIKWLQAQRDGLVIARDQYIQQAKQIMNPILNNTTVDTGGTIGGKGKGGSSTKSVPTMQDFNLQMTKNDLLIQDQKAAGDLVKDMPSPYQMMFDEIKKQYLDKKDFDYGKDISKEWKVDSKGNLTNKPENRVQESMARDLNKFTGYAEKTLGGVSNIVGGLSQLGVEIPKGLQDVLGGIQGITSIVTGIASLVAMIEALTTVQTTESTIKSIPVIGWALAGGGIIHAANGYVPGNNYSGDQVPALLNSGELVLNKAQQNALANELQGNGMQNMRLRTEVSGRNLIVVIENDLKARGKGQLATFKG